MHRFIVIALALGVMVAGCGRSDTAAERKVTEDRAVAARAEDAREVDRAAADNTKKNERDLGTETKTAFDQGGSEADRTITQQIRQGVVADNSLSVTAKNVKIITQDGVVTLRGPVNNAQERTDIALMAGKVAGVTRVDNQLELTAN
jgi:osmotically-inducible protein OsmY